MRHSEFGLDLPFVAAGCAAPAPAPALALPLEPGAAFAYYSTNFAPVG